MSGLRSIATALGKTLLVVVVAAAVYVPSGYLALGAMYRHYGGSGHPPLPAAPDSVYWTVFAVLLPLLALGSGLLFLRLLSRLTRRLRERR